MNNKSITAQNIPRALLDKKTAKNHFGQFGRITKFIINPKRFNCIVEYETPQAAQNAILYGNIYDEDEIEISITKESESKKLDWSDSQELGIIESYPMKSTMVSGIYELPQRRNLPQGGGPAVAALRGFMKQPSKVISDPVIEAPEKAVPSTLKFEYENIIRKPAFSSEEKYRVLDARDKLLRLTMEKTTDIRKAKRTVGICPDMCPEKERLMREFQRQIASFETDPNDRDAMIHHVALKQYSRSSADQESPLAHELRPEPVLQRTMTFLLREIIDLCDLPMTNISDWFHFVWDRTRSIRKDITQQELCSLASVELVEQCARFHVHCAGRLIAEDISVFDQKINTENLTKCLQSLKYMYHDLALKKIECPNEAEFRGYIVLLNLNDSNFLWEIKTLSDKLKKSEEIRFGINVYLAMDSNNYVKFFNLIRETNYLNACILLRYFNQIRTKALQVILKSYTPRSPMSFSLSYLSQILAFEDNESTIQFLEYHGFSCDNDTVLLEKRYFFSPDFPFIMDRSINLIESKKTSTAGEVICGKQIPTLESFGPYNPHNSFDNNGFLKMSAIKAEDQNFNKKTVLSTSIEHPKVDIKDDNKFIQPSIPLKSPTLKTPTPSKSNFVFSLPPTLIPSTTFSFTQNESIFSNKDESPKFQFKFGGADKAKEHEVKSSPSILNKIKEHGTEAASDYEEVEEEENLEEYENEDECLDEEEVEVIEEENENEKKHGDENDNEDTDYDEEEDDDESGPKLEFKFEYKPFDQVDNAKKKSVTNYDQKANIIKDEVINVVVNDEIKKIAQDEILKFRNMENYCSSVLMNLIDDITDDIARDELIIQYVKISRYFYRWQRKVKEMVKKRETIKNFPIWLPNVHLDLISSSIQIPDYKKNIMPAFDLDEKNIDISYLNSIEDFMINLSKKSKVFWKLVFSMPSEQESENNYYLLNKFFKKLFLINNKSKKYLYFNEKILNNKKLYICFRKATGEKFMDEENHKNLHIGDSMNGFVFFVSENLKTSKKRLYNIIGQSHISYPLPVTVISLNTNLTTDEIFNGLELKKLIDDNLLDKNLILINDDVSQNLLLDALKISLNFLSESIDVKLLYSIEMENTELFLENNLCDQLWKRLDRFVDQNSLILKETCNINFVVKLYNNILLKLEVILKHNFENYPKLPNEFNDIVKKSKQKHLSIPLTYEYFPIDWKSNARQKNLIKFLKSLKLDEFNTKNFNNYNNLMNELNKYLKLIIINQNDLQVKTLNKLIKYIQISIEYNQMLNNNIEFIEIIENKFSWMQIIKIISITNFYEKLKIKSNVPNECFYNKFELNAFLNSNCLLNEELIAILNNSQAKFDYPLQKKKKYF